jgi:hypothetical protein
MTRFSQIIIALVAFLMVSGAQAALINRGGGFIYDDVLDITWTQNANINSSDYWSSQASWAANLSIVDTRSGAGGINYDDWRLASMDVNGDDTIVNCSSATELACRDNEYGYLRHQYGVTNSTPGLFSDVSSAGAYWSGTGYAPDTNKAWIFNFVSGNQGQAIKFFSAERAWAVREGDVAAVPIPTAVWLFGSALGLLSWMRRKVA